MIINKQITIRIQKIDLQYFKQYKIIKKEVIPRHTYYYIEMSLYELLNIIKTYKRDFNNKIKMTKICDKCGKTQEVIMSWQNISKLQECLCNNCLSEKKFLDKYGTKRPLQCEKIKEKMYNTNKNKYGCKNVFSNEMIKEKIKHSNNEKYGVDYPMQNKEIYNKAQATNIKKYGCTNPINNKTILEKRNNTLLQTYGVDNVFKNKEFQNKIAWNKRNYIPSSKNQRYICEMLHGELNYPFLHYFIDVFLVKEKIAIEYDGGGHNLSVKLGLTTEQNFKQHEIIRNNLLKRNGIKIIRIISNKDKLYSNIKYLIKFCKKILKHTKRSFIEINIDKNTLQTSKNVIQLTNKGEIIWK